MPGRTDPFDDLEEILDVMTGQFTGERGLPVDVADDGEAFVVVADLPGYDREAVDVQLTDDSTLYLGAADEGDGMDPDRWITRERARSSVSRTLPLPEPVVPEETEASLDDGVLTVTLPKRTGPDDEGTDIPVN